MREKLRIPIDRWVMSKTNRSPVDKMIDLGIALEALYVTSKEDIGKKLRHRASWYLGENPADQQELETEFEAIYNYRSRAVHEGKFDKEVEIQGQRMPISEFIESVQDRCRRSILEIIMGNLIGILRKRQSEMGKQLNFQVGSISNIGLTHFREQRSLFPTHSLWVLCSSCPIHRALGTVSCGDESLNYRALRV